MKIGVASDHRGFVKKNKIYKFLTKKGYEVIDFGTESKQRTDFPKYAFILGEAIAKKNVDFGIVFCGSGIGVSIAANKVKGIRCAKINNRKEAKFAKLHNNANIIAFGNIIPTFIIKDSIDMFLKTKYLNKQNYEQRNKQIFEYESKNDK